MGRGHESQFDEVNQLQSRRQDIKYEHWEQTNYTQVLGTARAAHLPGGTLPARCR